MMDSDSPVTTDELHAYVDGMLPADRRAAVEAWLATHQDAAAQVAEWRAQADAIRVHYGAVATEPVPAHFNLDRLAQSGGGWRGWRSVAAAALVAAFVGAAAGWLAHGVSAAATSGFEQITVEALNAHKLYVTEVLHPIEVRAGEEHLLPWLSRRVGAPLRAPDLESYSLTLLGGRLLPGPNGPAALFMYETPAGERYTFYCARTKTARTALRYNAVGAAAAVLWVESDVGYVVSGPAVRSRLFEIAQTAYQQMESRASTRSSLEHDPEKARPGLDPGWKPVFGQDHALTKSLGEIALKRGS
jgi:anti-sigma factor RsiW